MNKSISWAILLRIFLVLSALLYVESQEQDPMTMNGGSVLAMAGKECVALAVDKRFASANHVSNGEVGRVSTCLTRNLKRSFLIFHSRW